MHRLNAFGTALRVGHIALNGRTFHPDEGSTRSLDRATDGWNPALPPYHSMVGCHRDKRCVGCTYRMLPLKSSVSTERDGGIRRSHQRLQQLQNRLFRHCNPRVTGIDSGLSLVAIGQVDCGCNYILPTASRASA